MTPEVAQRRLMGSIADLGRTKGLDIGESPDPLAALAVGLNHAVMVAIDSGQLEVARVYTNLGSLVLAVREELKENIT